MFKKTIKFTDFNDVEQEQDFWFHLSKAELAALSTQGKSLADEMREIEKTNDGMVALQKFRWLVGIACGLRSEDGARFIKTPEAQSQLLDSPAFDELLMELITGDQGAVFISQLIPEKVLKEMTEQAEKASKNGKDVVTVPDPFKNPDDVEPAWIKEGREPTRAELQSMTPEQLQAAFRARMTPKE